MILVVVVGVGEFETGNIFSALFNSRACFFSDDDDFSSCLMTLIRLVLDELLRTPENPNNSITKITKKKQLAAGVKYQGGVVLVVDFVVVDETDFGGIFKKKTRITGYLQNIYNETRKQNT